ncbi:uracil-DNA glycosylase [Thiolapillus sp.]
MDAERRQQYLNAMGIVPWVRRDPMVAGMQPRLIGEQAPPVETTEAEALLPDRETVVSATVPQAWEALRDEVAKCRACELHRSRTHTVFGVGAQNAGLMIIGEAPGAEEDRQGEPFVGRAGRLLDAMLHAIGLGRDQVFIANILKCRPPGNRNPRPDEVAACGHFLEQQLALVQPRLILALGAVAAHNLLHTDDAVGRLRSRVHSYGEAAIPLLVTYHPAYLLRRPEEKAKVWEDLQKLHGLLQDI